MELLVCLLLALICLGFVLTNLKALLLICTKSKKKDEQEKENLSDVEQIKAQMFGTKREAAVETLRATATQFVIFAGAFGFLIFMAWQIEGLKRLWLIIVKP